MPPSRALDIPTASGLAAGSGLEAACASAGPAALPKAAKPQSSIEARRTDAAIVQTALTWSCSAVKKLSSTGLCSRISSRVSPSTSCGNTSHWSVALT